MIHYVFETKAGRVTDWRLPGAIFQTRAAYDEFAPDRRLYEAAVAAYAAAIVTRVKRAVREDAEWALGESLEALGYSQNDVRRHLANPGKRDSEAFCLDAEAFSHG